MGPDVPVYMVQVFNTYFAVEVFWEPNSLTGSVNWTSKTPWDWGDVMDQFSRAPCIFQSNSHAQVGCFLDNKRCCGGLWNCACALFWRTRLFVSVEMWMWRRTAVISEADGCAQLFSRVLAAVMFVCIHNSTVGHLMCRHAVFVFRSAPIIGYFTAGYRPGMCTTVSFK